MRVRFLTALVVFGCMPAGLAGQSLGEVARKEKERRAKRPPSTEVVITEADLARQREGPSAKGTPTPSSAKPPNPAPFPSPTPTPQAQPTSHVGYDRRTEQYWRERKARLENTLRACEIEVAGIEGST